MNIDLSKYPKQFTLRDGRIVTVRTNDPATDEKLLSDYMISLPDSERIYFRDDVLDPSVIEKWVQRGDLNTTIPLLAVSEEGKIVSSWTLHHREHGWTRQNAFLRGTVHPDWRQKGLAAYIIRELLKIAGDLDIERVVIELVSPQGGLLKRYTDMGFEMDATLKHWVKDFKDRYHDLHIISMKLEPAWRKMEAMIADYGTHGG